MKRIPDRLSVQNGARIQPRGEVWLACSRASAQYQMELIASDAKKRAALYQFVVWRGRNLNRNTTWTNIKTIVEHIKDDDDRVWYGRNFAFYALATGREDLVENLNENNVSNRCAEWLRWLSFEVLRFRSSTVGWFWYANPHFPIVDKENPWSGGMVPKFPEMIVRPSTPLPNWEGEPLPLRGDQYLDHS
ncbi:hypothetical protein KOR42_55050 [Thalassoglobus neptunius]|uniref:Uncharacterized protein n=2 Tax=Thalassoglobus neptunius TaxID=1938619 RepID=A0A5C5UWK5_9PLAN|nr:hypothetical protein KOR42_55050 [Thalassoglobus neptunius]